MNEELIPFMLGTTQTEVKIAKTKHPQEPTIDNMLLNNGIILYNRILQWMKKTPKLRNTKSMQGPENAITARVTTNCSVKTKRRKSLTS